MYSVMILVRVVNFLVLDGLCALTRLLIDINEMFESVSFLLILNQTCFFFCILGISKCKVASSLLSSIAQSAFTIFDAIMKGQSEFD